MQFTAIKENLVAALALVQKAMNTKNTIPILSGIHLKAEHGILTLTTTDSDLRIVASLPVEVIEPGDTVVQGKAFTDLVRRLPDTKILFEKTSKNGEDKMTVRYGDARATMNGWPGIDYPTLPEPRSEAHLRMEGAAFKRAVGLTSFAVNADEIRPVFTGLLMEIRGQEMTVVGTDSFRLAKLDCPINNVDGGDLRLVIPVRALSEVARMATDGEMIDMYASDERVRFVLEGAELSVNLIRGEYPPYQRVIPSGHETFIKLERESFAASIDRATLFSQEQDGTSVVRLILENTNLHIHTESEYGEVNEHLPVYHEGEGVDIAFNARFLSDAMKAMRFDAFDVSMNGALGPAVFRPQSRDDYLYLLLPLRR